jgi:hypothetical protein
MTPNPFEPALIGKRLTSAELAALTRPPGGHRLPRPANGEQYLGGPVPRCWLTRAAELPGRALHLGIALWYAAGRSRGKNPAVRLTTALAKHFGLASRTTRDRALASLRRAGLVSVETRVGKTTVVTILPTLTAGTVSDDCGDEDRGGE